MELNDFHKVNLEENKFARILVGMARKNESYRSDKVKPLISMAA